MIHSIGTDLVSLSRIKRIGVERLAKKILSDEELKEFELITHEGRKLTYLGGRFAGKEALFKCFKTGDKTANYKDFCILNDPSGAPYVTSKYTTDLKVFITLSHTDTYAVAFVILENQ